MSESLILILMLPVLLVFSAIASGSETALFRLTFRERADLRRDAPGVGAAVGLLLDEPRRVLLMILIINMVVNIVYFVISSILTARAGSAALGVAVGAGSVLSIVLFGEILAKVLAGTGRRRFCVLFARPLAAMLVVSGPMLVGIDRFVLSPLIRVVRPGDASPGTIGRDELVGLIESGHDAGVIAPGERRLLEEVLELGEIRVREAMLPRDSIAWIDADASRDEVLSRSRRARATTILVCRGGLDGEVIGFLHVKRYLASADTRPGPAPPVSESCEPLLAVPEQARLDAVLDQMRLAGVLRALCVDERGSVVGTIRASDIVDELLAGMGEDAGDAKHTIHLVSLGVWNVRASLGAREWAQSFGIDESEIAGAMARSATIGGIVLERLGRLAEVGDEVTVGPASLRVCKVTGRRIDELEVRLDEPRSQQADADGGAQ